MSSILIVTVTKVEARMVLEEFGGSVVRFYISNKTYYNLGVHGGIQVYMVQSEMGNAQPGGSLLTVSNAIRALKPKAVIMCGIAFGLRPQKQKLGDIMVAKQLEYYEPQKIDTSSGRLPRGDRVACSDMLLDRFRSGDLTWKGAKTYFGLVLSGEKLVNSPDFRKSLLEIEPEAIGGEMEGAGLYVAAREAKVDWILVKAICDWADGEKNDDAQPLAARNAAQFTLHVIEQGYWEESELALNENQLSNNPSPEKLDNSPMNFLVENKKKAQQEGKVTENELFPSVRFLDALDSSRFSTKTTPEYALLLRTLYVKAQFFLAMIAGDTIVVTENQLFDSYGFLETFDELLTAAQASNPPVNLPIEVALRETHKDVFEAAADGFGNEKFILSLWEHLQNDDPRRKEWSACIRKKIKPDEKHFLPDEKTSFNRLWKALNYFSAEHCTEARELQNEFSAKINRVTKLSNEFVNQMLTQIDFRQPGSKPERKYFSTLEEAEAAKEIISSLKNIQKKIGEVKTRSLIRDALMDIDNNELREGLIELTDGIYNQNLGIATKAGIVQTSTFPVHVNKYISAGYALSTYIQDTDNFIRSVMWELFTYDGFENIHAIGDKELGGEFFTFLKVINSNIPWSKLIKVRQTKSWETSIQNYREAVVQLQTTDRNLFEGSLPINDYIEQNKKSIRYQQKVKQLWKKYIAFVSKRVSNDFWTITPTMVQFRNPEAPNFPVRIGYSCLSTKRYIEDDTDFKLWQNRTAHKGRMDQRID